MSTIFKNKIELKICLLPFFIIFISCNSINNILKISGNKDNGFIIEDTFKRNVDYLFLKTIKVENKFISSGTFIFISGPNNRELNLFVSEKVEENSSLRKIIKSIEKSNNPNEWPFYYFIKGEFNVDSYIDYTEIRKDYIYDAGTIIGQNSLFNLRNVEMQKHKIKYQYVNNASFCLSSIDIHEMNMYNKMTSLDDGPQINSSMPYYIFNEKDKRMKILLVKTSNCN